MSQIEVTLIDSLGNDLTVVNAARVSFAKKSDWEEDGWEETMEEGSRVLTLEPKLKLPEKDVKLLNYLAKHKHYLPFRHPQISLHIKAPIFVFRQLDKHQVGFSTSEISRRYVDTEPEMFMPDKWRKRADNVKQGSSDEEVTSMRYGTLLTQTPTQAAERLYEHALHTYEEMLDAGVAPEQARMVLPQAMITEQYKTGSLLGWHHLVSLRKDAHAQKEIQEVAIQIEEIMMGLFPKSWEALSSND